MAYSLWLFERELSYMLHMYDLSNPPGCGMVTPSTLLQQDGLCFILHVQVPR